MITLKHKNSANKGRQHVSWTDRLLKLLQETTAWDNFFLVTAEKCALHRNIDKVKQFIDCSRSPNDQKYFGTIASA